MKAAGYFSLIAMLGSLPNIVKIDRPVENGDWLLSAVHRGMLLCSELLKGLGHVPVNKPYSKRFCSFFDRPSHFNFSTIFQNNDLF